MSKIATYFGEKFFMGIQEEIYAEHYKSRNVWSHYSGSIQIIPSIKARFFVKYWRHGQEYNQEIWLDGEILNMYEFLSKKIW
jgi:hypothetical protein